MSKILISYRREDSADVTGRIYDRLKKQFGRDSVFKDVDSIRYGVDFRTHLDAQVAKCQVFLAVIGRGWMRKRGGKGKSRLEDPGDFVRIEIESALKREIPVIPVLVTGATIPVADRLPTSIQDLSYRQGIAIRADPDFDRDMHRLIKYLKEQMQASHKHPAKQDIAVQDADEDVKTRPPAQRKVPTRGRQERNQAPGAQTARPRVESPSVEAPAGMVRVPKGPFLYGMDKLRETVVALTGKRVRLAVLGARAVGKTSLIKFLSSGSIPGEYKHTLAPEKASSRRFQLKDLDIRVDDTLDVSGSKTAYAEWKELHDKAHVVFYLLRADRLIAGDSEVESRVRDDLRHIGSWLQARSPRPRFFIIGTHCDFDSEFAAAGLSGFRWGDYVDKFRRLPIVSELVALAGGAQAAKVVLGSMKSIEDTEVLVYQIFSQVTS